MSQVTSHPSDTREANRSSTVSSGIILILSGYLVGATAAQLCPPVMEGYTMAAGAIGMMGFVLFTNRARQKQADNAQRVNQEAVLVLERRVEQHVRRVSGGLLMKPHIARPRPHGHYLTVVRSTCPLR